MRLPQRLRRWLVVATVPLLLTLRLALRILRVAARDELPDPAAMGEFLRLNWLPVLLGLAVVAVVALVFRRRRLAGELPGDAEARRGLLALDCGEYREAAEALEKAVHMGVGRHDPAELHTMLGNAYVVPARYYDAVAAHRQAVRLEPRSPQAWSGLGAAYRRLDDLDEAERCYHRALSLVPDYAFAHNGLAVVYMARKEPERAVEALERAIAANPRVRTFQANLAVAYAHVGRRTEAEAALKRARSLGYEDWRDIQRRIEGTPAPARTPRAPRR